MQHHEKTKEQAHTAEPKKPVEAPKQHAPLDNEDEYNEEELVDEEIEEAVEEAHHPANTKHHEPKVETSTHTEHKVDDHKSSKHSVVEEHKEVKEEVKTSHKEAHTHEESMHHTEHKEVAHVKEHTAHIETVHEQPAHSHHNEHADAGMDQQADLVHEE